ncbi:hypothetical protein J416_04046 [Gracilibacillus halophilus YIM-C55.5]|uniref:LysM domain-containing protein n=1 Tax=Gracilibacillus halophilus YIM-C55.5 TaxID=1308866 RepID=N4WNJ4_9BACI|nr:3D domain-containing protein [Gracilibacillus halophilus]ENH97707.1 hypothetical protein J416_04046 [Gracilibacillus halophilus YIM-C55.5]
MRKIVVSIALLLTSLLVVVPLSATEYEVVEGDSLWEIAQEYDTTVAKLKEMNDLESDLIVPKQTLQIDKEITYQVQSGDTLSEIALEYGVTVDDIKEWNQLSTNLILVGEELTIKGVTEKDKEDDSSKKQEETKQETEATPVASEPNVEQTSTKENNAESEEKTITMEATAYTAQCDGCSGTTATGINLLENRNMKVIAVDPNVIPLGTRVHVEGYGEAIAADTGGAINGNRIDVHVPTKDEAYSWGRRQVKVTILES